MTRKSRRAAVPRGEAGSYASVASQFHQAAQLAGECGYWNAAGLLLVHAAIAFADAVAIARRGEKSTSDHHMDALALFEDAMVTIKGREAAAEHLRRILDEKNRVSYSGETFRRADFDRMLLHATRFRAFSEGVVKR